ncbi:hypothetical protein CGZ80_04690 [Rhodopirellula sp. MGV]|nr:hypothetical protein CGZ80_04690 [Rhodopirellula sp. MGV]PNY34955.1 hypothetical protein C2E31_20735 [Rhodopirellula baltica]
MQEYVVGVLATPTLIAILWLTAFGGTTLRQHVRYERSGETPLTSFAVAELSDDGTPITADDGSIEYKESPLTVVEYRTTAVVTDDHQAIVQPLPTVLFVLLESLFGSGPLTTLGIVIALTCIVLFFVTSSDSASMVIDIIASGGNPVPPVGTRLFWAITEGLAAAALLTVGGLKALQAASITVALPFAVVLLLCCVALVIQLYRDQAKQVANQCD